MDISFHDMVIRLAVSALLAAFIGVEREAHEHPAGMRTHILVCIGSTLFTLCSYSVSHSISGHIFDPARITAQIVTGVGFLGAGTIIHRGSMVRGLTTAASIWAVAAIGVAVGIGGQMLLLAVVASVFVFATLAGVRWIESIILVKREERMLNVSVLNPNDSIPKLLATLSAHDAQPHILSSEQTKTGLHSIRIRLRTGREYNEIELNSDLIASEEVAGYIWE